MRSCGALFVRFLPSAPDVAAHDAVGDCDSDNAEKGNVELHAVFFDFRGDFVLRQEIGEIVAHADKKRVPEGGADSCVENECPDVHPCQSGGMEMNCRPAGSRRPMKVEMLPFLRNRCSAYSIFFWLRKSMCPQRLLTKR